MGSSDDQGPKNLPWMARGLRDSSGGHKMPAQEPHAAVEGKDDNVLLLGLIAPVLLHNISVEPVDPFRSVNLMETKFRGAIHRYCPEVLNDEPHRMNGSLGHAAR